MNDARYVYWMHDRFRNNFLGNFKELVKLVNVDAMTLVYLSGIYNVKEAPNENYARELFELFTIGKGPIDGQDSYTYYTESDIIEASKILTGWQVRKNYSGNNRQYFTEERHDTSTKTFSSKFSLVTRSIFLSEKTLSHTLVYICTLFSTYSFSDLS